MLAKLGASSKVAKSPTMDAYTSPSDDVASSALGDSTTVDVEQASALCVRACVHAYGW